MLLKTTTMLVTSTFRPSTTSEADATVLTCRIRGESSTFTRHQPTQTTWTKRFNQAFCISIKHTLNWGCVERSASKLSSFNQSRLHWKESKIQRLLDLVNNYNSTKDDTHACMIRSDTNFKAVSKHRAHEKIIIIISLACNTRKVVWNAETKFFFLRCY